MFLLCHCFPQREAWPNRTTHHTRSPRHSVRCAVQISLSTPCAVDATHRNSQRGKKKKKRVGGRAWAEQSRQERWTRRGAGRLRRSRPFLKRRAASASKPQVRMPAGMANLGQWGWVGGTGSGEGCYHSSLVVLLQSQGGCVCSVVILKLVRESGRRGVISMFSRSGSWYWRYPLIWNTWAAWRARAHAHVCAHRGPAARMATLKTAVTQTMSLVYQGSVPSGVPWPARQEDRSTRARDK